MAAIKEQIAALEAQLDALGSGACRRSTIAL
jgi:hypothetical protein